MYKLLMQRLPASQAISLRDDQRIWLGQRNRCGCDRACLLNVYSQRIQRLATIAESSVISAVTIERETGAYRIELSYPKFGIPAADAQVQSIVEKAIAEVKADPGPTPGLSKFDLTGSYSHVYVGADVISVRFDINTFLGGAHGSPAAYGLNFDRTTGKAITLDEALALIGKTLQQVSTESITQLNSKLGSVMSPEGAAPAPENYSTFLIGPNTVTFIFQPYQVGSFADGMPEVEFRRVRPARSLTAPHELGHNSQEAKDLSATEALDAAIDILLGDPYGPTVDAVRRDIKRQERVGGDDPNCEQPAWKFTVSVPASELHPDGINGFLCLSPNSGKMLTAGLPFLD